MPFGCRRPSSTSETVPPETRAAMDAFMADHPRGKFGGVLYDLADGIVAALDRGRIGESYILSGDPHRMAESVKIAARLADRQPPRLNAPIRLLKLIAPVNDRLGGLPGLTGNLREAISSGETVTYWANHGKPAQYASGSWGPEEADEMLARDGRSWRRP